MTAKIIPIRPPSPPELEAVAAEGAVGIVVCERERWVPVERAEEYIEQLAAACRVARDLEVFER